jgi:hypothetical protein
MIAGFLHMYCNLIVNVFCSFSFIVGLFIRLLFLLSFILCTVSMCG